MGISTRQKTINLAKQGAMLGALLAVIYYTAVVVVEAIATSLVGGAGSFLTFFPTLAYLLLVGLIPGVPAGLTAMAIGFLTGLILPKVLSRAKPRYAWQAGLIGFLFSSALAITVSAFFGFPSEILFFVEIPLSLFVASSTYVTAQLPANPDAVLQLLRRLQTPKVALGLFIILVVSALLLGFGLGQIL